MSLATMLRVPVSHTQRLLRRRSPLFVACAALISFVSATALAQAGMYSRYLNGCAVYERVVTKIENPDLERICAELGLTEVICPDLETAKELSDLLRDYSTDLSVLFAAALRIAVFPAGEKHQGTNPKPRPAEAGSGHCANP